MPLHEVADTDPETAGPTEERGSPVQNEAGHEQGPAKATCREASGKQQDGGEHVGGTENRERLYGALLRGPHEDAGVDERDDHVAHTEGDPTGAKGGGDGERDQQES